MITDYVIFVHRKRYNKIVLIKKGGKIRNVFEGMATKCFLFLIDNKYFSSVIIHVNYFIYI